MHPTTHHRRLVVLELLADADGPIEFDQLAALVAAREAGGRDSDDDEVGDVRLTLHHIHLPKLEAADAVVYDPDRGTVVEGPTAAAVRSLFESMLEASVHECPGPGVV